MPGAYRVGERRVEVGLEEQTLWLYNNTTVVGAWPCSTAANGAGERHGSGCTPRGVHHIRALIGADCAANSVFVGRRPTGERYDSTLAAEAPARDWILSRIIWISGDESGFNRGPGVDTLRRFIYIHGTPDSEPMGVARSHGCIRMRNADVIALFDQCQLGMPVIIREARSC